MRYFSLSVICLGIAALLISGCKKKKDPVPVPEGEVLLPRDVVITDAEYSKARDILVYVSTNPSQLNIFSPSENKTEAVKLDFSPMSVSVSQDGNFAAVGFDGHLSHIDLRAKRVINTYDVSCESLDIVLNKDWAYVFPKRDQWQAVRSINLTNGQETLSSSAAIYAGTKARLHPSGKFLYATNNFVSPTDIQKFDIQTGPVVPLYDSPYHGDYPVEGDLWFSEDGKRVFLKGQTVMKLSENHDEDMRYNGSIRLDTIKNDVDNNHRIYSLDHSAARNKLYLITTDTLYRDKPEPAVRFHLQCYQSGL
jgi:DNA-binding beta-propeller fold protein YncE